jgi:hypothetical protein
MDGTTKTRRRDFVAAVCGSMVFPAATSFALHRRSRDYTDNRKKLAEWIARNFVGGEINLVPNLPSGRTHGGNDRSDLKHLYWLQNCNLFAFHAMRRYDRDLADRIERSYRKWYSDAFADCEERTEHYLAVGRLPGVQPPDGKFFRAVVKRKEFDGYVIGTETIEKDRLGNIRDDDPRTLLKFGVIGRHLRGDKKRAEDYFHKAISLWDGAGFVEQRSQGRPEYHSRLLAYALIADRAMHGKMPRDMRETVEERLWSLQEKDGGLWTDYCRDGSFPDKAKKSAEIAPLALLAYADDIWS